ncbi:60S ribosomal protein L5 [Camellia lanceoleosa]|uniref:60S ribosomal protein L5 n=1 Tax=Camellia lanceoleosa TaxID=1840588 RepID=A0ACC0II62_9ERIC|nr:60S ribosomal protein L5 [Camellia lanceoleosa]
MEDSDGGRWRRVTPDDSSTDSEQVREDGEEGDNERLTGALDGRLDIPHSDKRFSGFSKDSKQLDAEVHRKYIYGGHVAAYMKILMEDEPEKSVSFC